MNYEQRAIELIDSILPRRHPQFSRAANYLAVYLATDAPTRRLAMRALRNDSGPDDPATTGSDPPASANAGESGPVTHPMSGITDVIKGAASPRAAEGLSSPPGGQPAGNPVSPVFLSLPKLLWCGGKACQEKGGIEIHRADASCSKFHPTRRAR